MKYLREFQTAADYNTAKSTLDLPNVSFITETNGVAYKPYVPPQPITYTASAKLAETTSQYSSGLHTNAFSGTSGQLTITSHTFENGVGTITFDGDVTSIGNNAFSDCSGLTSITIPNSVTRIGFSAFSSCTDLTSIGGVGSGASVEIPNTVTSIGNNAFAECKKLTSITIPDSVTSIGMHAFSGCISLTSITSLAMTAPTIKNFTFYRAKTGGTLYVPNGSTGYDTWMSTSTYYLGYYNWTKVEQ